MKVTYKSAIEKKSKIIAPPSRLEMIRKQTNILESKLSETLNEIGIPLQEFSDQSGLKLKFNNLLSSTYIIIEAIHVCSRKINPSLRNRVSILRKTLLDFGKFQKMDALENKAVPKFLLICIQESINAIDDFVVHFDTICDLTWNGHELPFRPTDRLLKKKFLDAVIYFDRNRRKGKFVPYKEALKLMGISKSLFSEKTYGDWKKQMYVGEFHHFQPTHKRFRH